MAILAKSQITITDLWDGIDGAPGTSSYFHVKYSPVPNPTSNQMSDDVNTYIGTYVDENQTDSTDPKKYQWIKIEGLDGENGVPGKDGSNGQTSYLHVKYSDNVVFVNGVPTGSFTANNGETPGAFIGQYVDFEEQDSSSFTAYQWYKIKGEQGPVGPEGTGYTINITGGTRGVAYNAAGEKPSPNVSQKFTAQLLKNGKAQTSVSSCSWSTGGIFTSGSTGATVFEYTPNIRTTVDVNNIPSSYITVSIKPSANEDVVTQTVPIVVTANADGLDWLADWNTGKTVVQDHRIASPRIFAGKNEGAENAPVLTGVALGKDVINGGDNEIGLVGYKKNKPVFKLDTDGTFLLSPDGSAGGVVDGKSAGVYFDGSNLSVTGNVRITGGTIGGSGITDIVNGANAGTDAKNELDNLEIGGRNLWVLSDTQDGYENNGSIAGDSSQHKTMKTLVDLNGKDKLVWQIWNPNKVNNTANTNRFAFFRADKTYISSVQVGRPDGTSYLSGSISVPSGAMYVRLGFILGGSSYDSSIKAKVELGTKPTDYSPSPEDVGAAIDDKVDNKQDAIFNKLFSNGTQGFVLEDGKVYINGEVIKANAISGNAIKAGTITAEKLTVSSGEAALGNLAAGKSFSGTGTGTVASDGAKAIGSSYLSFGTGSQNNNAAESAYTQVDLGTSRIISESRVYFYSQDSRYYWYKIKYSTDGTNWYYAVGRSGNNGWILSPTPKSTATGTENPTINKFGVPIVARYLRLYGNGNNINTSNHIYEWELYSQANTQISGSEITTGTLNAGVVSVTNLNASNITTGTLAADRINAKGLLVKNSSNETTFSIDSNGNVSMKGSMTITGGSVPSSILSGTIDNARLNSSIVTGASNGTSAKGTLDSNSTNWTNAYNRVVQWASGAVSGSTTINGGLIATNTITAGKIAVGDFTNYAEYTGPNEMNPQGHPTSTLDGVLAISSNSKRHSRWTTQYHSCKTGEKFRYRYYIDNRSGVGARMLIGVLNKAGTTVQWLHCSSKDTGSKGFVEGILTVSHEEAHKFYIDMFSNGTEGSDITGSAFYRDVVFTKMLTGEFIVDGTITANKLSVTDLTALGATIGGFNIRDGAIYSTNVGMGRSGKAWAFWAGSDTSGSAPFRVGHSGEAFATNLTINNGGITIRDVNNNIAMQADQRGGLKINQIYGLAGIGFAPVGSGKEIIVQSIKDSAGQYLNITNGGLHLSGSGFGEETHIAMPTWIGGGLCVEDNVYGTPSWDNNSFEIRATGGAISAMNFHRAGYTNVSLWHDDGIWLKTNGNFKANELWINDQVAMRGAGSTYGTFDLYGSKNGWQGIRFADWNKNFMCREDTAGIFDTDWLWTVEQSTFKSKGGHRGFVGGFECFRDSGRFRIASSNGGGGLAVEQYNSSGMVGMKMHIDGWYLRPNSTDGGILGHTSYRWQDIWCTRGAFNGSDSKLKENIQELPKRDGRSMYSEEHVSADDLYNYVKGAKCYTFNYRRYKENTVGILADDIPNNVFSVIGVNSKTEEEYNAELVKQEEYKEVLAKTPVPLDSEGKDSLDILVGDTGLTYRELQEEAVREIEPPVRLINAPAQTAMLQSVLSQSLQKIEELEQAVVSLETENAELKARLKLIEEKLGIV